MRFNRPPAARHAAAGTTRRVSAGAVQLLSVTALAAAGCAMWAVPASAAPAAPAARASLSAHRSLAAGTASHAAKSKYSSKTSVSAEPTSAYVGGSVTLSATVKSSGSTPTGTITFSEGSKKLCSAKLSHSAAHCTAKFAAAATYTVKGSYAGDSTHAGSSGTTRVTVQRYSTTTAVTASTTTPYPGQAVTLSAAVKSSGPAATGSVKFTDAAGTLCTGTLKSGTASCAYTWTAAGGPYTVTGAYAGDTAHAGSNGTAGTVKVAQLATTTKITSIDPGSVPDGVPAVVTVTVTSASGPVPTGKVVVAATDGITDTCTATLTSGTGSCDITPPTPSYGVIDLVATYAGDAAHAGSPSGTSELFVPDNTTTAVAGTAETLTATVVNQGEDNISPSAGGTGTVSFTVDGAAVAGCTNVALTYAGSGNNVATCSYTPATAGSYPVVATYSGDPLNLKSTGDATLTVS
jgi:hypothetical protein